MKKLTGYILTLALMLSLLPTAAFAGQETGNGAENSESVTHPFVPGHKTVKRNYVYPTAEQTGAVLLDSLPESYDARTEGYITPVKDQDLSALCWAFSACGTLEANMKKNGYGEQDLSELHMGYSTSVYEYNGEIVNKDQGILLPGETTAFSITEGGFRENAAAYLMRGTRMSGTVDEKDDPYPLDETWEDENYRSPQETESKQKIWYARDILFLTDGDTPTENEMRVIKSALMEYGALSVSMYWPDDDATCYRESTGAFYCEEEGACNHDVIIVGWDDSYSSTNFLESCRPDSDGAWLVKNSWGSDWGNDGYFWVSYEDACFPQYVTVYSGVDKWDQSMYVYETDYTSIGSETKSKSEQFAKVFPIASGKQSVESVKIMLTKGCKVQVDVIPGFKSFDDYSFASKGERTVLYPGWYTIDLKSPVRLAEKGSFAVVVKLDGADEMAYDEGKTYGPATSYAWNDGSAKQCGENLSIKAVTERESKENIYRILYYQNFGKDLIAWGYAAEGQGIKPGRMIRSGYQCESYNTERDGSGKRYELSDFIKLTEDLVLYAQWEANYSWKFDAGTLTISGSGDMEDFEGEAYVPWAEYRDQITKVVIEKGITSVGDRAFFNCEEIKSVTIPEGVTKIGEDAFTNCSSLITVHIPSSVSKINYNSFFNCESLLSINVSNRNESYSSEDGVLFDKNKTELICFPAGLECEYGAYTVPEGVETIGAYAFGCSDLGCVTFPQSLKQIGYAAFWYSVSLDSIVLPENLKTIEVYAFCGCSELSDVFFAGSEEQWSKVDIRNDNDDLKNACVHFSSGLTRIMDVERVNYGMALTVVCDRPVTVICALYDDSGRLVALEAQKLRRSAAPVFFEYKLRVIKWDSAKLFVLGENNTPAKTACGFPRAYFEENT